MSDKITEAVLALRGVLPKAIDLWFEVAGTYYSSGISGDVWLSKEVGESSTRICGKFEFLQRAKVLGFVEQTGYRWGVEYEAHGVKPELPDVQIEILISNSEWGRCYVNEFNWNDLNFKYFRIVDERYKPTTTEAPRKYHVSTTEAWFDAEAGVGVSYPPAGTKCEAFNEGKWRETYIVGFDSEGDAVFETSWEDARTYDSYYNGHRHFRPLGWDEEAAKERKVEAKVKEIAQGLDSVVAPNGLQVIRELVRKGKIK